MASNDGKKLTVFGLGLREHHSLRMQQVLRGFQRLPENPGDRTALFMALFSLAKDLPEDKIQAIQSWLQNGGEFPSSVLPAPPAPPARAAPPAAPPNFQGHQQHFPGHQRHFHGYRGQLNRHRGHFQGRQPPRMPRYEESDEDDDEEGHEPAYNAASFDNRYGAGRALEPQPEVESTEAVPHEHMHTQNEGEEYEAEEENAEDEEDEQEEPGMNTPSHYPRQGTNMRETTTRGITRRRSVGDHEAMGRDRFTMDDWRDPLRTMQRQDGRNAQRTDNSNPEPPPQQPFMGNPAQHGSSSLFPAKDPSSTNIECGICAESYDASLFPSSSQITANCNHGHDTKVCLDCLGQHIQSALDEGLLHRLNCPFCPEIMSYEEIKKYSTPEAFARYGYLVMKDSPDVVMCLGRNCNKGQSHTDLNNPMMICSSCSFKTCVAHKLPWHEGQTCDEFDMDESQIERLERDEATAKLLAKEQSKICPNCHQGVTKQEGCDHMMCRCGNAWCFVCMASWENIMRLGETAHAVTCSYHPQRVRLRHDQVTAQQDQMTELVHGGRVSDALVQARAARNERVKKEVRPLALQAAERRAKEAEALKKEVDAQKKAADAKRKAEAREAGHFVEPPKQRPRLLPAWEER
ncbi:E3 ubiquitin-protein ligase [Lachnellula suecica]|uniref:RBR-type E3 ubiquitin transferase n=1 Tax=Lachnellula suecica TaxID=602035 RepID=A0A8T9C3C0_9HELO|nr:E3 ubiquitin-protein ligase [Lachnellula suecica]